MKKLLLIAPVPLLAIAGLLIWQNLPEKRYAKHVTKARMYSKENNLTAARLEYEKAFAAKDGYTPYASLEVLTLTNRINLQDGNAQQALENTRKFVETHKTNKDGRILHAQLAFQLGDTETAFDALNVLMEMDPWNFQARLLLTNVRARQGRLDLAEQQLRYLYGKYPDSVRALLPLAEVLMRARRSPESREFLNLVLAKDPKDVRARMLMVDGYLQERKLDSAQLMLDAWQESDPEQAQNVQIRKARLYSLAGRLDEAKAALAPYLERNEKNLQALSELAIIHAKTGNYDSAVTIYRIMGEISPKARMASESMSYYLFLKGDNPAKGLEALKTMQITDKRPALLPLLVAAYLAIGQDNKADNVIAEQPDSLKKSLSDFRAGLLADKEFIGQWALITYFGVNKQDAAVFAAVEDFYKRWPKQRMAIEMRTGQLSAVGRFTEAAKVLATLEKPDLTQRVAFLQLLSNSGQMDKAKAEAEKLAADFPKLKGVNVILADYWMRKDKAKAAAHYEKELEVNPGNTVALNNLAWEYGINQASLEKAGPYLDKLKAAKNLDPRILDTIGWILAVNGKGAEGERYVRNALDLVPDYPPFQYHLAYILKKSGKADEARKLLESALASKAPFEERAEAQKLLAEQG